MVMAVYQPGNVEISTTISIGVIGVMVMVILFYLWLCVVSLYQSLKEIQNLGSDQARIMVIASLTDTTMCITSSRDRESSLRGKQLRKSSIRRTVQ